MAETLRLVSLRFCAAIMAETLRLVSLRFRAVVMAETLCGPYR